jgi:peptidoglycan/xylan/chitin deacetylase (PgdA/CDA1 family)
MCERMGSERRVILEEQNADQIDDRSLVRQDRDLWLSRRSGSELILAQSMRPASAMLAHRCVLASVPNHATERGKPICPKLRRSGSVPVSRFADTLFYGPASKQLGKSVRTRMEVLISRTRSVVRRIHLELLSKPLPVHVAIYLHEIQDRMWPAFREMVAYFQDAGYRFAGPDEFLEAEERIAFLSFDDNYRSFWTVLPLLEELDVVATFYVNTCVFRGRSSQAEIDGYFDRLHFAGERVPLSVAELRGLAAAGHVIGAHGHSHRMLTTLPAAEARQDIERSKQLLEDLLGHEVAHFSYPYGMRRHFNEHLRRFCRSIGFRTIANAIPGMQFAAQSSDRIQRSGWGLDASLDANLTNLRVDGRWFQRMTGRSAVG